MANKKTVYAVIRCEKRCDEFDSYDIYDVDEIVSVHLKYDDAMTKALRLNVRKSKRDKRDALLNSVFYTVQETILV